MTKIRSTDGSLIKDARGQGGGGGGGGLGGLFPGMGSSGGGGGLPGGLKAGGGILGIIIALAAVFLPKILNSGQSLASTPTSGATCSTELEQVVCGAVNDVSAYWKIALPQYFGTEYRDAFTEFFTDSTNTGCGNATSQVGPFYCPVDEQVYLDLGFMQQLEQQLIGTTSDLAEQYIVAHEYGHHVQNILGTNAQVQKAQQNDPSNANKYSIALELQADCFAGVWVGSRDVLSSPDEINEALAAAEGVGDDRIQEQSGGQVNPEEWTHGSAEQRQQWFTKGFQTQDPRQCNTFQDV